MINLQLPKNENLKPSITIFGVGGAGGNAVNNMIESNLEGATFVVANTDAQALDHSKADYKVQLGLNITQGLGAGANPEVGQAAAEEANEELQEYLQGSNMVFVTAGMGGGTGTGAAPVIAKQAKEQGILTVGVVTKPFHFEGKHRMNLADSGLEELQKHVDTLITIPNQNLFRLATDKTTMADAFKMADNVLHSGVRGVTDLMVMPGLVNLDFADIRAVMSEMGKAMMGTGEASGDNRSIEAAEAAISNPLLDDVSMKGAKGVLINITGGDDMTLFEVDEAANRIREEVDESANIIFGSTFNNDLNGTMRVSVVATGIENTGRPANSFIGSASVNKPLFGKTNTASSNTYGGATQQPIKPTVNVATSTAAVTANTVQTNTDTATAVNTNNNEFNNTTQSNSFSAEKPVVAQTRPSFTATKNDPYNDDNFYAESKKQSSNFFEKLTKSFVGNRDYDEPKIEQNPGNVYGSNQQAVAQSQPQQPTQEKEPATVGADEYYEIPAFLRRQNNS